MAITDRLFPLINDVALRKVEPHRRELLSRASGTVLELGVGSGLNAGLYGGEVERIIGVEPDDAMWQRGRERARETEIPVERIDAFGESLPLEDDSVDTAVSTFVLCSVEEPAQVLRELHRVVRPGGRLLVLEHVENPSRFVSACQKAVTPVWRACLGGCHPGRDLVDALDQSPWRALEMDFVELPGLPTIVDYDLAGDEVTDD